MSNAGGDPAFFMVPHKDLCSSEDFERETSLELATYSLGSCRSTN
jgi:hypothetical protein